MDVKAPASQVAVQDSALDTTPLPADHAPKFLAEAKCIYNNSRPPFVRTMGNSTDGLERAVFIAINGQRPLLPIRANLVAKRWGPLVSNGTYWTLDLNGERFIVQSFPNNGCISGAKWVYCCWTGVCDEFEDLPLAFTCINGEYTSRCIRSSKAEPPAVLKQQVHKEDVVDSTIANILRHNHLFRPTPLHRDCPVEYLDDAVTSYMESRPPFVVRRTRHPHRHVLLATEDGQFSATSRKAEIVYRVWDQLDDFPTLDLDGKRFIVMGNPGGPPGGYQYHLWLGSNIGRVKKVVAFSGLNAAAREAPSGLNDHLPKIDEDSSSLSSSDDAGDQDHQAGITENQEYSYEDFIKAFDLNATPPSAPTVFHTSQLTSSSEPPAQRERPHSERKSSKRARSRTPPANSMSREVKARAKITKQTPYQVHHASDHSPGFSNASYEILALTSSTKNSPVSTSEAQIPQTQAPTSLPALTPYKQTHTTLRATRDSKIIGFVPLRLLTCMTMSTLFSNVIAASGHQEHEEPIKYLRAAFDWKEDSDVYKTIYIDKGTEGSFEIFLEIIDEAPCWKDEGGKCGVAVEIVRS